MGVKGGMGWSIWFIVYIHVSVYICIGIDMSVHASTTTSLPPPVLTAVPYPLSLLTDGADTMANLSSVNRHTDASSNKR